MSNTYAGTPDARQADDIRPSRFRPRYRALSPAELALHDAIKAGAADLEQLFAQAEELHFGSARMLPPAPADGEPVELRLGQADPAGQYFADGMRALELAVMWTVKGLTAPPPETP